MYIDSIIGNYTGEPKTSGVTNTVSPVTAVTLNLGEKPSIRFYVTDTSVEFYANGAKLNTVSGVDATGSYVELDVYAYVLAEVITYANGGSYHVSDFVNGSVGTTHEALVKSFVKYTESAAEYRNSVLSVKHNYTTKIVPPTCESDGYTLYTCLDCGYSYEGNRVEAHGHAFGDWYVSEEITKTTGGKMRQNCSNCDGFNTKDIAVVTSGNFGNGGKDNAIYTIYEDGTLKITGTGKTYDCAWNGGSQPYIDYRSMITRVIVSDGITAIMRGSFARFPNLVYADLSDSITEYPQALFMESFAPSVTTITVPANIIKVGSLCFGRYEYDANATLITAVYFENPNTVITESKNSAGTPYLFVNTYTSRCKDLVIYSYGSDNSVKTYADTYGLTYVDLNSSFSGEVANAAYSYSNGVLTIGAVDTTKPVTLPENSPWLTKVDKTDVTEIVITGMISEIPTGYFKNYTALTSVTLPNNIDAIGSLAFATDSACTSKLSITVGDGLLDLSDDFLKNRSSVTVTGFSGTALDSFFQSGVTVNLKKAFKLLLIGNSLSNDAADVFANGKSQLYNIIKAMVGDDVYVEIGVLYSGAKTAQWHANTAAANDKAYSFYLISDDTNGIWKTHNDYTTLEGVTFDTWDIVTLQPYGNETLTGFGNSSEENYYALSDSIPYLLDFVNNYVKTAKIYYYLTWSNSQSRTLNAGTYNYNTMLGIAKTAYGYVGAETGKGFDGLIPVGTAIQNARSTYLALQYYVTDNSSESWYFHTSLQRDNVHLSTSTGRYIAGLSFAEILVPEELRLDSYVLPGIAESKLHGALPEEFTKIAQLAVQAMLSTLNLTGDAQYSYTVIEGYETEPGSEIAKEIEKITIGDMAVSDKTELLAAIKSLISKGVDPEAVITVSMTESVIFSDEYKNYTVEISVRYGCATTVITKTVRAKLTGPTATVVNKNNADATVTFVIDDGNWETARFAKEMLLKYSGLTVSFAVPTKQLATLKTADSDGDGIPEYVMVDGKYVYEVNQSSYEFWQDILFETNAEIINHSYTHGFWGTNDNGGTFEYVKNGESTVTLSELMPKGSSTKEIYASKQILEELFPNNISKNSTALSFITPGIGIKTVDHKLSDGGVVTTYKKYFDEVLKKAYNNGELIGANSTFGATYDPSLDLSTKVVTKDNFSTYESRMAIPRYMVEHYNANPEGLVNDDISNWTDYIDSAIDLNGWACFCIHMMIEKESASGHNITEAQAEMLFKYALDNNVWVATNTDAILYFSEWSTSSVSAEYTDGKINVTLTDNERDDVYNMALTVKVSVPDNWQSATDGADTYEVLKDSNGVSYVLVDIVPDSGAVTLSERN